MGGHSIFWEKGDRVGPNFDKALGGVKLSSHSSSYWIQGLSKEVQGIKFVQIKFAYHARGVFDSRCLITKGF